jgi:hypothetical protein
MSSQILKMFFVYILDNHRNVRTPTPPQKFLIRLERDLTSNRRIIGIIEHWTSLRQLGEQFSSAIVRYAVCDVTRNHK